MHVPFEAWHRGPYRTALAFTRELAVASNGFAGANARIPDVAVRRRRDVAVLVAHLTATFAEVHAAAACVVRRPDLFDEIRGVGAQRERVTVVADFGIDVEIVERDELPRERVRVRRDLF